MRAGHSSEKYEWTNMARYRFDIRDESGGGRWVLYVYQAVPLSEVEEPHCNHNSTAVINGLCECGVQIPKISYWGTEAAAPFVGSEEMGETEDDENYSLPDEFKPFFSDEPLPQSVVEEVLSKTDVNPINWTIDKLFEGPNIKIPAVFGDKELAYKPKSLFDHGALTTEECEKAPTVAGCIYHPAPVRTEENLVTTGEGNPTPRNEEFNTPTTRKRNVMESYIDDLREKLSTANETLSDARDKLSELQDFVYGLETYTDELDSYIDSLESAPEFNESFDYEASFDSDN